MHLLVHEPSFDGYLLSARAHQYGMVRPFLILHYLLFIRSGMKKLTLIIFLIFLQKGIDKRIMLC